MPKTPKELQVVPWRAKRMESELRLCIRIPPRLPSLQHPHPPGTCASPLPQSQRPRAMGALLPTSPVPIAVPARGAGFGQSLLRARCSGCAEPGCPRALAAAKGERNRERRSPPCLPLVSSSHRLAVGARDLHSLLSKLVQTQWAQSYERVLANRHKCKQIVQKQKSRFFRTPGKRKKP